MARRFIDSLSSGSYLPKWLTNRVASSAGFKLLWVLTLQLDIMVEYAIQGIQAAWPGHGTPTALPLIGQSRGIPQGPHESDDAYAAHLQQWLSIWSNAGSESTLAQEVQRYLTPASGPLLTVQVVTRRGFTYTANPDGTITESSRAWNWDGVAGWIDGFAMHTPAEVSGWWSDLWILVAPDPFVRYTSFTDPAWLAAWAAPNSGQVALGHEAPQTTSDGLISVIAAMKGAHQYVRAVIFCASVTTFAPGGTFGNNTVNGTITRDRTARYWEPFQGG